MTRIEELSQRLRDSVVKTRDGLGVRCSIQAEDVLAASNALLLLSDAEEALEADDSGAVFADPLGLDGLGGSSVKKTASPEPRSEPTSERGETAPAQVDSVPHKELIRAIRTDWRWHSTAALLCADALEAADKRITRLEQLNQDTANALTIANADLVAANGRIAELEAQVSQLQRERDEAVSAVQRLSEGQSFDAVVIADTAKRLAAKEIAAAQATIKRMQDRIADTSYAGAYRTLGTYRASLLDSFLPADTSTLDAMERDSRCMDWIEDHCTTMGGGDGFELRVWIPVDSECIRGAILTAIAQEKKA